LHLLVLVGEKKKETVFEKSKLMERQALTTNIQKKVFVEDEKKKNAFSKAEMYGGDVRPGRDLQHHQKGIRVLYGIEYRA
jgi:hypothetical protein